MTGAGSYEMNNMETIKDVQKAFREARIAGEQLLEQGKITWEQFSFTMLGYEAQLKSKGMNL